MGVDGVWCFIVCFGIAPAKVAPPRPIPIDTYCQTYRRIVLNKQELEDVLKMPRNLRNRIQGNDLDYLCRCQNPKNAMCSSSTGR